ncbi:ABC transporter permease [Bacillus chungangensis]|uniref:ABC-2 type transport system permease protein n=1 Tax=Bacillus chungangensis TaxID=587633 RepID=A0ABT9WUB8_9BACI|nr:ABC transporter permease [Bacillus chungangensis]MDQ0176890.1 ABC-2 type transport system permease protein [Bacillus chungangensis]
MNSRRLFFQRNKQEWKYQYRAIMSIFDWTIILYILVPALFFSGLVYRSWWLETPQWAEGLPVAFLFVLLFLLLWNGHFRTYIKDADRIYLLKKEALFIGLKKYGIRFHYIFEIMIAALLIAIIAPIWMKGFSMSVGSLLLLGATWLAHKWLIMSIKRKWIIFPVKWKRFGFQFAVIFILMITWGVSYYAIILQQIWLLASLSFVQMMLSFYLMKKSYTSVDTFEEDLVIEEQEHVKYIQFIFTFSFEIEKAGKAPSRRSPRLFANSRHIFKNRTPRNAFIEMFIKVMLRNRKYFLSYLQLLGVTNAVVLLLPPIWMKILLSLGSLFMLRMWIALMWSKVMVHHPILLKYRNHPASGESRKFVVIVMMVPFALSLLLFFILSIR